MYSLLLFFLLAMLFEAAHSTPLTTHRFQHWYWYDESFANILRENCSVEYNNYVNRIDSHWYMQAPLHSKETSASPGTFLQPVLMCLLQYTNELVKANMASASVLLGLMPTILGYAGSTLAETNLLAVRRPLLALMLAMGSPSVPPRRALDHADVPSILERRKGRHTLNAACGSLASNRAIAAMEMFLALAAFANVILTSYELGMKTFLAFQTDIWSLPLVWSLSTAAPHLWGCFLLQRDIQITSPRSHRGKPIIDRLRLWAQVRERCLRIPHTSAQPH